MASMSRSSYGSDHQAGAHPPPCGHACNRRSHCTPPVQAVTWAHMVADARLHVLGQHVVQGQQELRLPLQAH